MSTRRLARLNEEVRRVVSEILRTEVRDPRIGLPTVTEVEVTPDLWLARIYVRPDPTQTAPDPEGMLEGLRHAAPFIRRELGKSLRTRRVPELRFEVDRTIERSIRIEKILQEVLPRGEGAASDPEVEGAADGEAEDPPTRKRDGASRDAEGSEG